jgi:hypothetical protein
MRPLAIHKCATAAATDNLERRSYVQERAWPVAHRPARLPGWPLRFSGTTRASKLPHQCLNGLCFRCCSLQRTIRRNSPPKHKFLMHLHARPRPWDAPKQIDGGVLYSLDWADYRRMHSIWQRIFRMFQKPICTRATTLKSKQMLIAKSV